LSPIVCLALCTVSVFAGFFIGRKFKCKLVSLCYCVTFPKGLLLMANCENMMINVFPYQADSSEYWCETEGGDRINLSANDQRCVPAGSVILDSPVLPVTEGDCVTLRCRSQKTSFDVAADFYKDGLLVGSSSAGEMVLHSVSGSDEGLYKCSISSVGESPQSWLPGLQTQPLVARTCNVTLMGEKESELVWEVERYQLDIVGLTSTHSLGSGTQLLERGWMLHFSGIARGERRWAGVGLLIAPQLSCQVLEFTPVNERVASLRLQVGDRSLTVVLAYGPNSSAEYPAFLDFPNWGLLCSSGGLQHPRGQRQ
uniref:Ig-like domain-containing protein n=1 Tax=Stegastes partitus TaxID=144197 RepID=A0A3B5B7Z8_9TELE